MEFKGFQLDKFQEDAINSIDEKHSVMVSAPTGSGKTLIADYIIDKDLKEGKRVIYTAPIKALSNQKYKDFVEQYGGSNIGLITGDVVENNRAQILIMTTEIYRNMAIMKDPLLDSVSYCIMDEIHYINDPERGYVWEESIIFSPEHIRFLFLSATVPNDKEFADWVRSIKNHEVISIRHDERPVPLEIKFYDAELGITTLDEIRRNSYPDYYKATGRRFRQESRPPQYYNLVRELKNMDKLPCIFFTFSRAKTQDYSVKIANKSDFLTPAEKSEVSKIVASEFSKLSKEIGTLESSRQIKLCLAKGVAFHHAGLLPDVKHVVEKLFSKGLIKVLFATETFAVGINMPARTVCFDSLRKYTGTGFRYLNSKEFFQISGRAGRRGIDKSGLAVAMLDKRNSDFRKIESFTKEDTEPIKSQFRLTYNTVLNMINLHSQNEIGQILTMSFFAFQEGGAISAIKARYDNLVKTLTGLGYVKNGQLTELGFFASKIFSNEIEISQIFAGQFDLIEYEILLVLCALVYEERKDIEFRNVQYSKIVDKLVKSFRSHKVLRQGKWYKNIKNLTSIVYPIVQGKKFIDILDNTSMPEGDLIRLYMQILDKLEQVDRASQDQSVTSKIRNCKQLLRSSLQGIHVF
ncbi:MAG: DEAD/DEAH box helicase [Nanoarchaeota archaeon]|nr:MAG: DEAD/DEAH box helicase [Nanoarchaeota archaeon]